MHNFHDLLVNRRSIRRYTDQPLDPESVRLILEAGLLAPTSKSTRAWQFIAVDDKDKLDALAKCKASYGTSIAGCVLAVVIAMDSAKDECWIEDAAVAATMMQLQAADLGLGSCWVQVRGRLTADNEPSEDYVRELLGIPEEYPVECIISFGHKDEERKPQNVEKLLWERVHIGGWRTEE